MSDPTQNSPSLPAQLRPLDVRRAGVLLHVTSLPSAYGPGDLGPNAHRFVDLLAEAGCTVWQVLPLVPTHDLDRSPYNAPSAMAGNPDVISIDGLVADGLLEDEEADQVREGTLSRPQARALAAGRWQERLESDDDEFARYDAWRREHDSWLDAFVEFSTVREALGHTHWTTWDPPLRDRDPAAVAEVMRAAAERTIVNVFEQYVFARQWRELRDHAAARGVLVFGDMPIFVSHDSADVWAGRELFLLDETGNPTTVTGVPPDYFAAEGQKWNNPHYDWDRMAQDDFAWWRHRVEAQREVFDLVRIDHFRGFEAAWHVPADAPNAIEGEWVRSPGREVLAALVDTAGAGRLVAEDLGTITPEVEALRREFEMPGMKILHFAFGGDPENPYLPARHGEQSVVYTGTHDNDTTIGWWESIDDDERARVRDHLVDRDEEMPWALVRLAMASTSRLAVVPAQDLLGLGSEHRMNTPGTAEGNWAWQAGDELFSPDVAARLRGLVEEYDRCPPA